MTNEELQAIIGTDEFPANENDVYGLIETIASQRIVALKSANRIENATFDYDVEEGKVIQEAIIKFAEPYAYDKTAYDRAPKNPELVVRYFSDYDDKQFETTVYRDDVRAIIANKGQGIEDLISQIISTLTEGEGKYRFEKTRELLLNENVPDYSEILGGVPKTMKGVIYAARNAFNHLRTLNSDLTVGAGTDNAYVSETPESDIYIAMTDDVLNLVDVVELSNIFNLSKEELFGILVKIPSADLPAEKKYQVVVYDRKAMGRARRIYDFTEEYVAKGRYANYYLTSSYAYFYNMLFKAARIDCTVAAQAALGGLIESPFDFEVDVEDGTASTVPETIQAGEEVEFTVTAGTGYALPSAITVANAVYTYNPTTGKIKIYNAIGDVTVSVVCVAVPPTAIPLDEIEATDVITSTDGVLNVGVDVLKSKADVEAIIYDLLDGVEPSSGTRRKYLFGAATTYPNLYVYAQAASDEGASLILTFASAGVQDQLFSASNLEGWNLNIIDKDGKIHTSHTSANAVGTLTDADAWNGIIFGKLAE